MVHVRRGDDVRRVSDLCYREVDLSDGEKSLRTVRLMVRLITNAKAGNEAAEKTLRKLLGGFAENCPKELLIRISELVLKFRKDEMRREAESN